VGKNGRREKKEMKRVRKGRIKWGREGAGGAEVWPTGK
jgi:hypothetical protein